ncbi:unnamed protein product [Durusdinium trenchii]|uniref:dolichyl-diphosphooligosaccharide--protein glycotransferase n=1 Tax=Durusdinium trenchii TaxID=1381693 RepID=A0ABP0HZ69_9DINO
MIGVHALMLVAMGRFTSGVHRAYSLFFIVGTLGAIQIPVVGMQPLRSLEQMGPLLVFIGFQVLAFCDFQRHRREKMKDPMGTWEFVRFRIMNRGCRCPIERCLLHGSTNGYRMCCLMLVALAIVAALLYPTGYFGPLSSRIRGALETDGLWTRHVSDQRKFRGALWPYGPRTEFMLHQQLVAHLLLTRVNNPRCPSQPLASAGSLAMQSSKSDSAIICPRGALPGWRLPREGPEDGGGEMKVMDRLGDLEAGEVSPAFTTGLSRGAASHTRLRASSHESPAQHRWNEVMLKHKKIETTRERDQKYIGLMVEHKEDLRQARMTRLVESITSGKGPDYEASLQLNFFHNMREKQIVKNYMDWDENIFGPAARKAFFHLNRRKSKRLSFHLEEEPFRLYVDNTKDPAKRPLQQSASEKTMNADLEAAARTTKPLAAPGSSLTTKELLRSQSRPVLEPDLWGMYGSSVFGRFNQILDPNNDGRSLRRQGRNAHLPSTNDGGGEVAGTKHSRLFGYHDKGVLQSHRDRGEATVFKSQEGSSCAAPAQDHFTYPEGPEVVSLSVEMEMDAVGTSPGSWKESGLGEPMFSLDGFATCNCFHDHVQRFALEHCDLFAAGNEEQCHEAYLLHRTFRQQLEETNLELLEEALKEAKCCEVVMEELFALLDYQSFLEVMQRATVATDRAASGAPQATVSQGYPREWSAPEVYVRSAANSGFFGLFVKHTKTGNPLVDSVAEHQPANPRIYASHLGLPLDYVLLGGLVSIFQRNNGFYFMCLYGYIASHFSGKMSRLVLICGPIVSVACGIWCGFLLDMVIDPFLLLLGKKGYVAPTATAPPTSADEKSGQLSGEALGKHQVTQPCLTGPAGKIKPYPLQESRPGGAMQLKRFLKSFWPVYVMQNHVLSTILSELPKDSKVLLVLLRCALAIDPWLEDASKREMSSAVPKYIEHCKSIGQQVASPTVMYAVQQRDGSLYIVRDYYDGYKWLEQNTATDARVMAWWDYGTSVHRTSIADGNTWNHEHIATLGRTLTSEVKRAHNVIRHLADYVLVWGGGQRDDLGKSPHLARIGNSVFPDHCGDDDPKCNKFGFYSNKVPTPMMEKSLLYKLVEHNNKEGVSVNEKLFKHVHTTKHGLMRIYEVQNVSQESKDWIADPKNRICDAPGSWYCSFVVPTDIDRTDVST